MKDIIASICYIYRPRGVLQGIALNVSDLECPFYDRQGNKPPEWLVSDCDSADCLEIHENPKWSRKCPKLRKTQLIRVCNKGIRQTKHLVICDPNKPL